MPRAKRLIVGLGNPGREYEGTRHNVGFDVADAVAVRAKVSLQHEKGNVFVGWGSFRGYPFGVAKPQTFMNLSGAAVRNLVGRYGLNPTDLLIVYDDINLEPGQLRLRPQGSAGGHNGMQDVIDALGTDNVPRLRFGVGSDFSRGQQVDYVLAPFSDEQQPLVEEALVRARDAAFTFVREGIVPAMNRFN